MSTQKVLENITASVPNLGSEKVNGGWFMLLI